MRELPEGWEWTSISEIGEVVTGSTPSTKQPEYFGTSLPFYKPTDLDAGYCVTQARQSLSELGESQCRVLPEMSILVTCIGATIGKSGLARKRCATNQQINAIVPHRNFINPSWLYWMMTSPDIQNEIISNSSSTTLPILNKSRFSLIEIPLPPLNEQKRIADRLDQLLTSIDKTKAHLDRIPPLLKRFRQSVLAAATSGKLTEEWREDGIRWSRTQIKDLCISIFDGPFGSNLKSDDYTNSGARVIRLENLGHLKFIEEKTTYISLEKYENLRKHTLQTSDIIFSSFVDEEMRACLFPNIEEISINKADCFCIRVNSELCNPEFLVLRLACRTTFLDIQELVHGVTRPRINLKQLRQLLFDIPTLEEQQEIVRRVEALFVKADRIEAQYKNARQQVDRLTPALLAKAFRGELVPQDPKDEPASVLLERVKEARSIAQPAKAKRKAVK